MKMLILCITTQAIALAIGFAAGVYFLPILTAPNAPSIAEVEQAAAQAAYSGEFRRDLEGSDLLHWGEGIVAVGPDAVTLMGRVAPGPDYKLYLAPSFVETETEFEAIRDRAVRVGDIDTFENFIVPMPADIDPADYNTVVVWCESFGEFITAATYR
ncbi:DM13 domain-containing protein [Thiohalocapsa sp.]|uniref:DM13 domain-containing protein n=1 Tax=Thiohalocapsa sp. TaxID=2497641 RepID=UPI0025E73342|nr:DM13 domain-containing protein [Thiohalocapsa sp.]